MNTRHPMIIIKGEIKTSEVKYCEYSHKSHKWEVQFNTDKTYSYVYDNVKKLFNPKALEPGRYKVGRDGRTFFNVEAIYEFNDDMEKYWRICFGDGSQREYRYNDLQVEESCLSEKQSANVLSYIREIANLSEIRVEETGEKILPQMFDKITFVGRNTALASYLKSGNRQCKEGKYVPVFPFGCNKSQYMAVKRAMENRISVIQGPPGTGKTQTILNIIANILLQGKTVQIVSNNNSATENVYDKLASPKYNLGFVAAMLGNSENKHEFILNQKADYPDFTSWKYEGNSDELRGRISEESIRLKEVFDKQENLALLKQELSQLDTEYAYFTEYAKGATEIIGTVKFRKKISSRSLLLLWNKCQDIAENNGTVGLRFRIRALFACGIKNHDFYKQEISRIIEILQLKYYIVHREELTEEINKTEKYLNNANKDLMENLCTDSMILLKNKLASVYGKRGSRTKFEVDDLRKKSSEFLSEYPVVLSTTFSSKNSLNQDIIYDYLIMDEASQVDIATGALALSCAQNAIIVGDTKQLPNVVTADVKDKAEAIFDTYKIDDGYRYTNSFLQSVLNIMPGVAQTMLREHYRCHPKIINFCNQKFYNGELIIMTADNGEEDVLSVVKTNIGNHERDHQSQRQIDIIKNEIIPGHNLDLNDTGIITPYRNQVKALNYQINGVDAATVHKFQGREKDNIIISTVDDAISDFADDPYLINVAVSRAKRRLVLVVTGNVQARERNITDLIDYIQYNNFEVTDSKIYSIFDYLYSQYADEKKEYLTKHKKISEFDSENLMYGLIEDVIHDKDYSQFGIFAHYPLKSLIKNTGLLNEQELRYAVNPATHLDFIIYNRISKKPVLAVEVDGYRFHKNNTIQQARDAMKNHIMELCEIPLLRFETNGSGEKEKIEQALETVCR